MNNTAFFAILIVLILGIIYVLTISDRPPETGMTQTPKEYIEYVEQQKAARRRADSTP
jgi:sugar phosphate permease